MSLLKLIALDPSDLMVVSAHLQDAVAKVADATFSAADNRFVVLCNRLDRQDIKRGTDVGERRRAAFRVERVKHVQVHGFLPSDRSTVLSILTLTFEPDPDPANAPAGILTVLCAGNAAIRLAVECVELVLEDLGPTWQAGTVPEHTRD